MKIEVIVHHISVKDKRYPVHKIVRHGEIYTAHYTTIKDGRHVSRKIDIDNVIAELSITR